MGMIPKEVSPPVVSHQEFRSSSREDNVCWYTVTCKPRQERVTRSNLERLGIVTFYPEIKESKIIRRKKQIRISPLFPGYLFAKFSVQTDYRAVIYARGARGVVSLDALRQ